MVYFQEGKIVADTCILVATEFPVRFILSVTVRSSFCLFTAAQGLLEIVYQQGISLPESMPGIGDWF